MASTVIAQLADLTDRALLILLLERTQTMATDLSALTATVAALQAAVDALGPALAASADLNTKVIAALESFAAQLAQLPATQAAIDGLNASVSSTLSALQTDAAEVAAQNTAVQAELDKVTPAPAPAPTPAP